MIIDDDKQLGRSWHLVICLMVFSLLATCVGCVLRPNGVQLQPKSIKISTDRCCCPKQFLGYHSTTWHSPEYFGSVVPARCCNRCARTTVTNITEYEIASGPSQHHRQEPTPRDLRASQKRRRTYRELQRENTDASSITKHHLDYYAK